MKLELLLSFASVKHQTPVMNNSNSVKCINEITKSPEDKRCYRGLIFGNEMKVLLISDSNTDKAAACLNVSIGEYYI